MVNISSAEIWRHRSHYIQNQILLKQQIWRNDLFLAHHIDSLFHLTSSIWSHHPKYQAHWNTWKMPQFHGPILLPPPISSTAYHNEAWTVLFQKTAPIWVCYTDSFELGPLVCKKVTIVQIRLKFIPSFTDQTHILLTHCIPVRLSRNS